MPRATEYRLDTIWRIQAPMRTVYDAVLESLHWPDWWQGVEKVEECRPGNPDGTDCVRRFTWKGALPYRVVFDARSTRVEPLVELEASVTGDLEGIGRWLFASSGSMTTVRYEWRVHTTRIWMNLLAPLAHPLFTRNHRALMQAGGIGLARLLNAPRIEIEHSSPDGGNRTRKISMQPDHDR